MQKHKGHRKFYYLDNAAATPIDPRVLKVMTAAAAYFGNPSSFNNIGRSARREIEKSRQSIAQFLGAHSDEVVFTSSGSEANNLAIAGCLDGFKNPIVITTAIEHKSVRESLKKVGAEIKLIPINKMGQIDLKTFEKMLTPQVKMVSVMYANNEIGTIEPIRQMAKIIKNFNQKLETENWKLKTHEKAGPLFHVDACQAAGFLDMNVQHLGVDLLSFDGCKIYGPHGIGALYVRRGTSIQGIIVGAKQEHGLKAGTENTQSIVGLAKAVSLINSKQSQTMIKVRDYAINKLLTISNVILNGAVGADRLPNNINIAVADLSNELLLLELDKYGIFAGSGSACTSHSVEPSSVIKAIGVPAEYINGALRFSLGRETTKKDMDYLITSLIKIIADLTKRYARLR